MKPMSSMFLLAAGLAFGGAAQAQVTVKEPWVRATVPKQQATGAFMRIESAKDTRLVAASSPVAPVVEIHEMSMVNNVMKMREVKGIDVRPGAGVDLKPGGYHVMLMNLPRQVKEGETVPLTLTFEDKEGKRQSVEVAAPVKALTKAPGGHGKH